jgi:hypothetical protein
LSTAHAFMGGSRRFGAQTHQRTQWQLALVFVVWRVGVIDRFDSISVERKAGGGGKDWHVLLQDIGFWPLKVVVVMAEVIGLE